MVRGEEAARIVERFRKEVAEERVERAKDQDGNVSRLSSIWNSLQAALLARKAE